MGPHPAPGTLSRRERAVDFAPSPFWKRLGGGLPFGPTVDSTIRLFKQGGHKGRYSKAIQPESKIGQTGLFGLELGRGVLPRLQEQPVHFKPLESPSDRLILGRILSLAAKINECERIPGAS